MITTWLKSNKTIVMLFTALAMVLALMTVGYKLADMVAKGGQAIGRADAQIEIKENGDAETAARLRVRDCTRAGRVWNDATGQCNSTMPAAGR